MRRKKTKRRIILRRKKSEEERGVPLWFEDTKRKFMVSVVGSQGDTRMRITTPKKNLEIGFAFADFSKVKQNKRKYAKSGERYLKELSYNAKIIF